MKGRLFLKPRAQSDLDAIWNYTANRWGLEQAETYTDSSEVVFRR